MEKEIPNSLTLPRRLVRLAAVGDIHCHRRSAGLLRPLFARMRDDADIILLCGDLTDYGLPEEAQILAEELKAVGDIPVVAVLGNHDFESGKPEEVSHILTKHGVLMLDGGACELQGVGFAGTKGFAGGFEGKSLEPWGEPIIKQFVHEAVNEALKLESALARLPRPRVAVLHYSPIRETVQGEPPEIIPYLGSRRLEEPLHRFPVEAVVHGHAHFGTLEGRTSNGIPVYNVALPLMKKHFPQQPYRVLRIRVQTEAVTESEQAVAQEK